MSNIYIQEPPALAKVLLKTSAGDIDIELWSKEAPKACRNFLQLCMEGYYKGTIFHRVIPGFIVQGGDPNGDGTGGESIYGATFKDEFHQRLRFNRRGLVAMANAGKDDNGSQFFFTLAATPELQNKHTIFGKVTGDTIYNVLKLAEGLIGPDDRPEHPHRITGCEVLINPFEDIVPRIQKTSEPTDVKKKDKRKAVKNLGLLSFGEEAEEEIEITEYRGKPKSTHDVLQDPKLSKLTFADMEQQEKELAQKDLTTEEKEAKKLKTAATLGSIRGKLMTKRDAEKNKTESPPNKRAREKEDNAAHESDKDRESEEEYYIGKERDDRIRKEREKLSNEYKQLKREMKGTKDKEKAPETIDMKPETINDNEVYKQFVEEQEKYKSLKEKIPKKGAAREDFTLKLLAKFKNKLSAIKEKPQSSDDSAQVDDDDDDVNNDSWLGHKLQFEDKQPVLAKDASSRSDDWFDIYDPRNPLNKRKRERSDKVNKNK